MAHELWSEWISITKHLPPHLIAHYSVIWFVERFLYSFYFPQLNYPFCEYIQFCQREREYAQMSWWASKSLTKTSTPSLSHCALFSPLRHRCQIWSDISLSILKMPSPASVFKCARVPKVSEWRRFEWGMSEFIFESSHELLLHLSASLSRL